METEEEMSSPCRWHGFAHAVVTLLCQSTGEGHAALPRAASSDTRPLQYHPLVRWLWTWGTTSKPKTTNTLPSATVTKESTADAGDRVLDHTNHELDLLKVQNVTRLIRLQIRPEGSIKILTSNSGSCCC